jgi:quinol monooxygenase YgiN
MTTTAPFAIIVRLDIEPSRVQEFIALMEDDAEQSLTTENGGCLSFDLLRSGDSNKFYLYEVYRDEEAFNYHMKTPHFAHWVAFKDSGGVLDLTVEKLHRIAPK